MLTLQLWATALTANRDSSIPPVEPLLVRDSWHHVPLIAWAGWCTGQVCMCSLCLRLVHGETLLSLIPLPVPLSS